MIGKDRRMSVILTIIQASSTGMPMTCGNSVRFRLVDGASAGIRCRAQEPGLTDERPIVIILWPISDGDDRLTVG
jgi:hypothetical protein